MFLSKWFREQTSRAFTVGPSSNGLTRLIILAALEMLILPFKAERDLSFSTGKLSMGRIHASTRVASLHGMRKGVAACCKVVGKPVERVTSKYTSRLLRSTYCSGDRFSHYSPLNSSSIASLPSLQSQLEAILPLSVHNPQGPY